MSRVSGGRSPRPTSASAWEYSRVMPRSGVRQQVKASLSHGGLVSRGHMWAREAIRLVRQPLLLAGRTHKCSEFTYHSPSLQADISQPIQGTAADHTVPPTSPTATRLRPHPALGLGPPSQADGLTAFAAHELTCLSQTHSKQTRGESLPGRAAQGRSRAAGITLQGEPACHGTE